MCGFLAAHAVVSGLFGGVFSFKIGTIVAEKHRLSGKSIGTPNALLLFPLILAFRIVVKVVIGGLILTKSGGL